MLSDVLGIAIAFITIILLLAILVTALMQATQAVLRLRPRNLMKGLAALIVKARSDPEHPENVTKEELRKAKDDASRILNASNIALLDRVADPTSKLHYWLLGPKVSWVEPKDLPEAIREQVDSLKGHAEQIEKDFERAQAQLQKRFLLTVRLWSFGWALVVAFLFQVSTPALLSELERDTERRERIVAGVDAELAYAEEAIERLNYEDAADEALQVLQSRYPDLRERIEEASGVGVNESFIVEELAEVLEGEPRRDEILEQYRTLLDQLAREQLDEARSEVSGVVERLGQYDIRVWPDGWGFYYRQGSPQLNAFVGVLITAILLSLGAPFWFQQLRNVVSLRDVLAKETSGDRGGQSKDKTQGGGQQETTKGSP